MYDPSSYDPLNEYAQAVEDGDFQRADEIRAGMASGLLEGTQQVYRLGQQAGLEAALAKEPPLSETERAEADKKYREFLGTEEVELKKSPERQAADNIVAAHKAENYENRVMPALKKIDARFPREYGD
jgi:hypothetical protein